MSSLPPKCLNEPGEWQYFLSHHQDASKDIALDTFHSMEKLGRSCWLDVKMEDRDVAAMEEGIKNSNIIIVIMSPMYFTRAFCVKELEWAVEYGKPIVVIIDVQLKGEIGNIIGRCPADKAYLKGIGNINFTEVSRANPTIWNASIESISKAKPKVLTKFGTAIASDVTNAIIKPRKRITAEKAKARVETIVYANEIDANDIVILEDESLGIGGFGEVFKAKRAGSICAAKVILTGGMNIKQQHELYKSFQKEFALMCSTNTCQRVIRVFGVVLQIPGKLVLVMEYAENGSLRKYLDRQADLGETVEAIFAQNIIYDIAYGMKELYKKGVHHRDLKADNVLLDRDMIAKVSDFGLSKADALITSVSSKGSKVGTPSWQSPEEWNDEDIIDDEKCDMYSFAITMYEILTCRLPWQNVKPLQIMTKVLIKQKRPEYNKDAVASKYDKLCVDLMESCWSHDSNERPTFSEIVDTIKIFQRNIKSSSKKKKSVYVIQADETRKLLEEEMEEELNRRLKIKEKEMKEELARTLEKEMLGKVSNNVEKEVTNNDIKNQQQLPRKSTGDLKNEIERLKAEERRIEMEKEMEALLAKKEKRLKEEEEERKRVEKEKKEEEARKRKEAEEARRRKEEEALRRKEEEEALRRKEAEARKEKVRKTNELKDKYKKEFPDGTPIVCACEKGRFEDVKLLITGRNNDVNGSNGNNNNMTLKEYVNQEGKNSYGTGPYTPLMIAAREEHFQIVKYLIEQGEADPNIADKYGDNALHYAAGDNKKDTKVIELLLTNMSLNSINKKHSGGSTPLDLAYKFNKSPIQQKIIDLIRSKGGKREEEL